MTETINIGVVLNESYIKYLYVMLSSIAHNNPDTVIVVYVLYQDIEDQKIDLFQGLEEQTKISLIFLDLGEVDFPEYLPVSETWPLMIYYHLLFADLLTDCDRILYLDTDVIVHGSLVELYNTEFDGNYVVACKDMTLPNGFEDLDEKQKRLFDKYSSLKECFLYFNTGMMLLNLQLIRQNFSFYYWMQLAHENVSNLFAPDQDLVNLGFMGRVKYVDEKQYNLFAKLAFNQGYHLGWVRENNVIVHYAGRKPWQYDALRYEIERLWWEEASRTPFYCSMMEQMLYEDIDTGFTNQMVKKLSEDNAKLIELIQRIRSELVGK